MRSCIRFLLLLLLFVPAAAAADDAVYATLGLVQEVGSR